MFVHALEAVALVYNVWDTILCGGQKSCIVVAASPDIITAELLTSSELYINTSELAMI